MPQVWTGLALTCLTALICCQSHIIFAAIGTLLKQYTLLQARPAAVDVQKTAPSEIRSRDSTPATTGVCQHA